MNSKYFLILGLTLTMSGLSAQTLRHSITQTRIGDSFGARSTGQTFTPNVGILPNPGSPKTIPLEKVTFSHGAYKASAPSATTYLNIYDGDPNSSGKFIGSSANSIDTRSLKYHDPMVWSFRKLALNYTTKYWAVMSSSNTSGGLNLAVSLETEPRTSSSYSGGAGLIANIVEHTNGTDTKFTVDFFTGIQGTFSITGTGCAGSVGVPGIAAPLYPQVGRPFQLEFHSLASGSLLYVILGLSDRSWSGLTLPIAVSRIVPGTAQGCTLYASLDTLLPMRVAGTSVVLPSNVPNMPSLFGVTVFAQGAQGESSGRLSMTALGKIFIGQ